MKIWTTRSGQILHATASCPSLERRKLVTVDDRDALPGCDTLRLAVVPDGVWPCKEGGSVSRPASALLCLTAAVVVSALWVAAYGNASRQPCTHGESSAAVAIWGGHVHVIRSAHETGCVR